MTSDHPIQALCRLAVLTLTVAVTACGGGDSSPATARDADAEDRRAVTQGFSALQQEADAAQALSDADGSATRRALAALPPVGAGVLPPAVRAFCAADPEWRRCGEKSVHQTEVNGQRREYIVWRPFIAALRNKVPVVFMFHGTSGDGDQFWNISAWREMALREGIFVVFPSALKHCYEQDEDHDPATDPEVNVWTKWADGQLGSNERPLCGPRQIAALTDAQRSNLSLRLADDVGFVRTMLAEIQARYPRVNPKQLYLTGFSNGAAMVGRLAAEMADVFAAAHCASSAVATQVVAAVRTARPIPIVHSIGDLDEEQKGRFGFENTSIPLNESLMTDRSNQAYFNGVVAPFIALLRRSTLYTYSNATVNGMLTSSFTYSTPLTPAAGRNFFRTTVIQGASHEYPNGRNHPIVMAEQVWPYFDANRLP